MIGEYLYKPWAFNTILIYLYMCVILVSVNISEIKICLNQDYFPNKLVPRKVLLAEHCDVVL